MDVILRFQQEMEKSLIRDATTRAFKDTQQIPAFP
jgi:hypothetical protein